MRAKRAKNAFTLIEVLVVVAIVAVLMAILMPALSRARESANRVACASNLRQWGMLLQQYAIDHKGAIPETCFAFTGRYPNMSWGTNDATNQGQFSAELMAKYAPQVDLTRRIVGKIWFCPSNDASNPNAIISATWLSNGYFSPQYAYFARVEKWQAWASRPTEIIPQFTRADRIWMSDVVSRWSGFPFPWRYNHGKFGSSNTDASTGAIVDLGPPRLTGANQLFGDGHVVWKPRESFKISAMQNMTVAPDFSIGWVVGGNWDRTFY